MTREYAEEVALRLGARSLGVSEGASEGDVLAFDADGEIATATPSGGSSPVTESGAYSGSTVSIADSDSAALPWDSFDAGTDLLDVTDPALPVVLKAGLFIISVEVQPIALTVGGMIRADLTFDYNGVAPFTTGNTVAGAAQVPCLVVSGSWKLDAGDAIQVFAMNLDGASTRSLQLKNAFVSRIGPA